MVVRGNRTFSLHASVQRLPGRQIVVPERLSTTIAIRMQFGLSMVMDGIAGAVGPAMLRALNVKSAPEDSLPPVKSPR
jgi:hypothetical protein